MAFTTMFKKALNIKSEQKLSDKETKKLQADATKKFGLSEASAAALLPSKPGLSLRKCGGGSTARIFSSEQVAVVFDPGDGSLVPTLASLWRMPPATFPTLLVPAPVAPFLIGGSDLMLPGVHGVSLPAVCDADALLAAGAVACVAVLGNPCAFAVGRSRAMGWVGCGWVASSGLWKGMVWTCTCHSRVGVERMRWGGLVWRNAFPRHQP